MLCLPATMALATAALRGAASSSSNMYRGSNMPTSWGYDDIPKLKQAGPSHWHLLENGMACEASASAASAQSPIDIIPAAVIPAEWLPTLKLEGGYLTEAGQKRKKVLSSLPGHLAAVTEKITDAVLPLDEENSRMYVFGNGHAPVWVNNGHTLELGPNHHAISAQDDQDEDRRLFQAEVTAASVSQDQKQLLSGQNGIVEEHFQAQQQFVNPNRGSIDIGGLSRLNFEGPTLAANSTDEGWDEGESRYDLLQLHLHWGRDDAEGSEHLVGGRAHPLEMHLVHTQRGNPYPTKSPGGLLAVSVMFNVDDDKPNPSLQHLVDAIEGGALKTPGRVGDSVPCGSDFDVTSLLPAGFEDNYMTYRGSLTTPGCFESVNWLIAGEVLTVSSAQLAVLRSVGGLSGKPMTHNFRPVQPRNGRVVWMKGDSAFARMAAAGPEPSEA